MFSFIIPTLNESLTIRDTLNNLLKVIDGECEIIVVDGGSEDNTADIAESFPNVLLIRDCKRGRAAQMNRGAGVATKEFLFFLHSDTTLDSTGYKKLVKEIKKNNINWGWFSLKLNSPKFIFRILETLASFRTKLAHEPLGDHGIFVKNDVFKKIGGYPEIPIMEDVELVKRLKTVSAGKRINHFVLTSVRRFERGGIFSTVLNISFIRIAYSFGKSPEALSSRYLNHR